MVIVIQLILALIIGILASGFYTGYGTPGATGGFGLDGAALLAFCAATVVSVLLARCIRTGAPRTQPAGSTSGGGSGSEPGSGRETGQVKWFNYSKGFGFITRASGDDVFIHYRGIRGSGRRGLREGQRVEFDVCEGDKGLQADDVVVLDDDSTP